MKKMITDDIKGLATVALCLTMLAGCSRSVLTPEEAASDAETVVREVTMRMADPEVMDVSGLLTTKTSLYSYDTSGISREYFDGRWHRVRWNAGDRTYCYCQTGVYMDYTLTDADLLSGDYAGQKAKTHVIYRVGDSWVTIYFKGPKIREYKGFREKERLVLENGVPNNQTGVFDDYHICLARNNPEADFVFENMQAYVRFEVTQSSAPGSIADGKLLGYQVSKITIQSLSSKDKMAGDLEMIDDGGWRTILQERGDPADEMITVKPTGGFKPSPTVKHYFVAIPARRYADGIRFNLYTNDGTGEAIRGFVDLPATTITRNQILNCHDLLKYCAIYVQSLTFDYGPETDVSEVKLVAGHIGKLKAIPDPDTATDQSIEWSVDDNTVCSVAQDGSVTALATGIGKSCIITAKAKDRGGIVTKTVKVVVTPAGGLSPSGYGLDDLWPAP